MRRVVPAVGLLLVIGLVFFYRSELQQAIPIWAKSSASVENPAGTTQGTARSKSGSAKSGAAITVSTVQAKTGSLPIIRKTIGSIVPVATTALASPLAGIVSQVLVKDGAEVAAGDLLVQLDDRTAKANVQKDQALLAKDQAAQDDAEATLKRVEALNKSGVDTEQQYSDAVSAAKQTAAAIAIDTSVLAADNVILSQTQIRAPFAGRLGVVLPSPGAYLPAGGTIATLTQMKPVFAEFTLSEQDLGLARSALAAGKLTLSVTPPGTGKAEPAQTGPIVFIDNTVDPASGTFKLRALLANDALERWPGETLDITVTAGASDGTVIVPAVAVQPQGDGYICFVVRADQTIEVRKVTVGLIVGDNAGVTAGLKDGEAVVTEGQAGLSEGTKVTTTGAAETATP